MNKPLLLTEYRHQTMRVIQLVDKLRYLAEKNNISFMVGRPTKSTHKEAKREEPLRKVKFTVPNTHGTKPIKPQVFEINLAQAEERILAWATENCPELIPKIVKE